MSLIFPILAGQGWSTHKRPKFSTLVASHVSGREVRAPLWQNPLWEFELTFDGLGSDSSSYPGLGAQSLQSLMGFFLQCQGQFGSFLYFDPGDYSVAAQGFGVGDGSTTSFQLTRTLGGFIEPVLAPFAPTGLTLTTIPPGPGGSSQYAPNNLITQSQAPATNWSGSAMTIAAGAADPNGGALGVTIAETAVNAQHFVDVGFASGAFVAGAPLIFSCWLKQGTSQYAQIAIEAQAPNYSQTVANIDLVNGLVTATYASGSPLNSTPLFSIVGAGGGWWRVSVSTILQGAGNSGGFILLGGSTGANPGAFPAYAGAVANTFLMAFPQLEHATQIAAPGAYRPTLAAPYYGGPLITRNGSLADPSAYSLNAATGVVTFNTPPAAGALLQWSGWFAYPCRFSDDTEDFEQFMQNLWSAKSIKLQSLR